jgi:pimeloyl-ACP methyl ester carboxylesterase
MNSQDMKTMPYILSSVTLPSFCSSPCQRISKEAALLVFVTQHLLSLLYNGRSLSSFHSLNMRASALLVALTAWMAVTPTAVGVQLNARISDPTVDPFYQGPSGFESKAPGTILRQRQINASFFGFIPNPVEAWQLLFRTTAINGSAIAGVTTVFKPAFPQKDRFVSFQTAYDSSSPTCDPSYTYQLGSPQTDLISSLEALILQVYLLKGYIVASTDYEGPDAAFSPGRLEGVGVLDGMRAVSNFYETLGFSTDQPDIVGVGYSGGAIATGWAASLHPTYAPELSIKGWVHGGTPSNLTGTMSHIDNTICSGFIPAAIDGLAKPSAYGAELHDFIDEVFTDEGKSILDYAGSHCAVITLFNFMDKSILSTDIQSLGSDFLYNPGVAAVLAKNIMGVNKTETPTAPAYVYHAANDEIIPYSNATQTVKAWCENGANVKFTNFAAGGHVTTEIIAVPSAVEQVDNFFAGNLTTGCTSDEVLSDSLDPLALGLNLEPILAELLTALGNIGDNDSNLKSNASILKDIIS